MKKKNNNGDGTMGTKIRNREKQKKRQHRERNVSGNRKEG